jgi:hypothetical protein
VVELFLQLVKDSFRTAHPVHVIKLDRMSLKVAKELLLDPELDNLKIVHLVRDPRAVICGRRTKPWCLNETTCIQPKFLCENIKSDYEEATKLRNTGKLLKEPS